MNEATPRITAHYLEQFSNRMVRIVGKVVQLRGEEAMIEAGGQIVLHLNRDSHLAVNRAFEIIGRVQHDLSVKVHNGTDFGTEFDFSAAEQVVEATHRYKEIFYGDDR